MHRSNTTFDVYLGGRLPPAAPDTVGLVGFLEDEWVRGNEANKGDRTFFFTATLEVVLGDNLPDAYPGAVGETTVWVPDHTGNAYTVVFVERERAFRGGDFQRVYLIKGFVVAITVEDVNLTNVYPSTTVLQFNDADGFVVTQPAANQARVALLHASVLQAGVVDTGSQQFAGYKQFANGLFAAKVDVNDIGGTGGTLAAFLTVTPTYYVAPGAAYVCTASFSDHREGVLLRNSPGSSGDTMALFLEQSNGGLDNGRLILLQNNNTTQPAYCVGSVAAGVATVSQGVTGTGGGGDHFTGGLCTQLGPSSGGVTSLNSLTGGVTLAAGSGISVNTAGNTITVSASGGGGGGLSTTIGYTKPGGATGSLTFTNGLLTAST